MGFMNIEQIIDDLLEQVMEKYTEDRVEKLRDRALRIWNGNPLRDRVTYSYVGVYDNCKPIENLPELPEDIDEFQRELVEQLQIILNHSDWDDDFFPALSPGMKQITIPSYFGCVEEAVSASSKVKPIINKASDVYDLPEIGFTPDTEGGKMLLKMRYFRQRTKGLLPVYETDMQGPFSVASQIWGIEEFMLALNDNPDEVRYLVNKCTDIIIEYFKKMLEVTEGDLVPLHCMPVVWFPKEKGVAVSEDLMAVVSPSNFKEFVRPGLERISNEFGGVIVHSCGSINHVIKELNQVEGLVGINFSSTETDLEKMDQDADKRLVFISHNSPLNRIDLKLLNQTEHIELCRKAFEGGRNIICVIFPWNADPVADRDAKAWKSIASLAEKRKGLGYEKN